MAARVSAGAAKATLPAFKRRASVLPSLWRGHILRLVRELEHILALFVAAVVLAAAARRAGAPYPVFLAIGGALLTFVPGAPSLSLPPDLVLALFVAPILVDAGYDASLRDLRDNWAPLVSLVVFAVVLTTAAVAIVAHALLPALSWAVTETPAPARISGLAGVALAS